MERIRKICNVSDFEGSLSYDVDEIPIYIARNDTMRVGLIDTEDNIVLPFEYDGIGILGFGILQLVQNGKFGVACVSKNDNNSLCVSSIIKCQYDYVSASSDNLVKLSKYTGEGKRDAHDLFFTKLGIMVEDASFSYISWNKYFIENGKETYIIDADTGHRTEISNELFFVAVNSRTDEYSFLWMTDKETGDMAICKLYEDDTYIESELYEDIFVIYMEHEEEPIAVDFVGKREDTFYLMGDDLKVYEVKDNILVITKVTWKTDNPDEGALVLTAYNDGRKMWWLPIDDIGVEPTYDSGL